MHRNSEKNILKKEDLDVFLDFAEKEKQPIRLNVIGGEPLIYPHLDYLLERLSQSRGISHMVFFTGGIVSSKAFDKLATYRDKLALLFNLNEKRSYMNPKHHDQVIANIEYAISCGLRCSIGYNIYRLDFNGEEIVGYCNKFGVEDLRFAVASPSYGSVPNMVVPPDQYPVLAERVFDFMKLCFENEIKTHLDCTLPLCFFSERQLGEIAKMQPQIISYMGKCGMPVDINYDLSVFRCFSFSEYQKRHLTDFSSFEDIKTYYTDLIDSRLLHPSIRKECETCRFSSKCNGGCLSNNHGFLENRSKNEIMTEAYALIDDGQLRQAVEMIENIRELTAADKLLLAHLYFTLEEYPKALLYARKAQIASKSADLLKGATRLQSTILSHL
jgi:radical SAM protein with 4Fe4S-binding SPASM domain